MITDDTWEEPASIEAAQVRRQLAAKDVADIQAQLGNNGMDADGFQMTYPEYQGWKRKAKFALSYKLEDLRRLNVWIKAQNRVDDDSDSVPSVLGEMSSEQLVRHLYRTARELGRRLPVADVEEAACRVRRFLDGREQLGGTTHPELVYEVWVNNENEPRELRVSDLRVLVDAVAPVVES